METRQVLPGLLGQLNTTDAAHKSTKCTLDNLLRLDPKLCPSFPKPAVVKVVNLDTLNAAIRLSERASDSGDDPQDHNPYPLIVNFASRHSPGGGWRNGAIAQEEAICYRSSLSLSLNKRHYPLGRDEALYSPYVLVMRHDMAEGHGLMCPEIPVYELPVVSAVTVAAIRQPPWLTFKLSGCEGGPEKGPEKSLYSQPREKHVFARNGDRNLTKDKMRLTLRIAAHHGHRSLVLGALGCGVFRNPPEDVAQCWREVLQEDEFSGNWWREVCFAVYDPKNDGNYDIFKRILHGQEV